jgi:5-methylcytosine-specific restriction endonuclease McrA
MKEKILRLRKEGKSYNQIKAILGCSKSTISYHCGEGQKVKSKERRIKRRENPLIAKLDRFKYRKRKTRKDVVESIRKYQKTDTNFDNDRVNKNIETTFTWEDVLRIHGEDTKCYLSGEDVNLYGNDYQFDHKIPVSRGGDNSFENLGIAHEIANMMKGDLTPDEFFGWCIKILEYNGYKITYTGDS